MRTRQMARAQINKIDPATLIFSCWVSGDDILVVDGYELFKMAQETWKDDPKTAPRKPTLYDAMATQVDGISGNSYEFVRCTDKGPVKLNIKWEHEDDED